MRLKIFSPAVFPLILLALLAVLVACETETGIAKNIADQEPDIEVSAARMAVDYDLDESEADEKYKGKVVLVTGVISGIYRGFLQIPYVDLKAGVRCNFSDNEDAVMITLKLGQTVSMKGRGDRLLNGVELRGCTIK